MSEAPPNMGLVPLSGALGGSRLFQLGAEASGRDLAVTPSLNAESETKGGRALAVLDFAQPTLAGWAEAERDGALFKRQPEGGAMCGEVHAAYSPEVNIWSSADIHFGLTDAGGQFSDTLNMAAPDKPLWYLREWFATQDKIQRTLITELGWLPAKANKVWHDLQEPKPSEMHEIAALLNIRPHELMMPPEEAFRIRRLEAAVREVAKEEAAAGVTKPETETKKRTGRAA